MRVIMQREIRNYIKNPLLWIGCVIVFFGIYQTLSPYLGIHYFQEDTVFKEISIFDAKDVDIMQGVIPSTEEEIMQLGLAEIKRQFIEDIGKSEKETEEIIKELEGMTVSEINVCLEEKYHFLSADFFFQAMEYRQGTAWEANDYIDKKLEENPFSYYFSRKFADFTGLFMGAFASILLAFLFICDTRRDTYELLHTKPVSAVSYVFGKIAGGFLTVTFVVMLLSAVFSILCLVTAGREGFSYRFWDIPLAAVIYILPNMLMVTSVYAGTALLFKTPIPAVPLMFLYIVYSNMGSIGPDGRYGYYGRPLAMMVRFPGSFFDVTPPPMALYNQLLLLFASVLMAFLGVVIWKRRRVY